MLAYLIKLIAEAAGFAVVFVDAVEVVAAVEVVEAVEVVSVGFG